MAAIPLYDKEAFLKWRDSPINRPFRAYLEHRRMDLARRWATGEILPAEAQMQARLLGDLLDLTWGQYAETYGLPVDDEAGEARAPSMTGY